MGSCGFQRNMIKSTSHSLKKNILDHLYVQIVLQQEPNNIQHCLPIRTNIKPRLDYVID